MATTQESYKQRGRLPRYTTKLSAFANGMYLTNQIIPEGFVKAMVNYDIDDTGTHIRPRRGREKVQVLDYTDTKLGPVTLTDYIYAYNKDNTEIESIEDIVASYGEYVDLKEELNLPATQNLNPIYLCQMENVLDENNYDTEGALVGDYKEPISQTLNEFWLVRFLKEREMFDKVTNKDLGFITARTIKNAYAFEKPFVKAVGRPVHTVLNNELIAFTGSTPKYTKYTFNPERDNVTNLGSPTLAKIILTNEGDSYSIKRKLIEPRQLNAAEALSAGFNIFSPEPYKFENEIGGSLSILGAVPYDPNDLNKPLFNPTLLEPMKVHVTYQYPEGAGTLKVKVEYLDLNKIDPDGEITDTDWKVLSDFTESVTAGEDYYYEYTPAFINTALRFTMRVGDNTETEFPFWIRVRCNQTGLENVEVKKYNLNTAKGLINWQGCLGVYGVESAPETIFFSDVSDPSYFPFPYNIITFDNEILAVHNYLDHLLVITVDSVWLIAPGTTINTSVQKRILANIFIPEIDAINLVVLKDQIFFKTDTQFYVLKPNKYTSDSTDLKNYTNSTALANYTSDFQVSTVDLLNQVYKPVWQELTVNHRKQLRFEDFDVLDTRSIVKDSEVHYIYTIVPKLSTGVSLEKLNLHLVYNTLTRSWRLYFKPVGTDSTRYNPVLYRNKQSGVYYEFFTHAVDDNNSNLVVSKQTYDLVTDQLEDGEWKLSNYFDNYTYIDTGNVAVDDTFTKRFREVQFNLFNLEKTKINFYVDFKVDGQEQVAATKYHIQHITDIQDPDYGKIYVTPVETANMFLYGNTSLDDTEHTNEYWVLDLSKFPNLDVTTVRFTLQGRGRRGSIQLLNTTLKRYQLSDINWVYRIMSAR